MESVRLLPSDVADALQRGGTVVTGNQRAARTLRLAFDRQSRTDGLASWQPPEIFAWNTWTSALWRQMLIHGASDRMLLNRSQELQIWRSVIAADSQWTSLQSVESLAAMGADAWQLLCAYRGQSRLETLGVSSDTRAFQRWALAFTRRCDADLYLPQAELEAAIAEALASGQFHLPTTGVLLTGFDSLTPSQVALLDALRHEGVEVAEQLPAPTGASLFLHTADTLDDELLQAAHWIRSFLEADPEARIAVILPEIDSERNEIDRVFRQILAPELQHIAADPANSPFEFSLGQPLAHRPMIAVAMKLLHWATTPLSTGDISRLLLSPYFANSSSELASRAEFDAFELRRTSLLRPELDLAAFTRRVERSNRAARLTGLIHQLRGLQHAATRLLTNPNTQTRQKSCADWADSIRELLAAAGWASAGRDDSAEFQTRRKWESALDELATLDFEGTRQSWAQAIVSLTAVVQRSLFAPESREAPVQIMDPQEAAGSRFDALYFLRASDLAWPTRPGLNPLLGWRLQRDLLMSGSDATQDSRHARHVTVRLAASAPVVVFSYARETADAHQRPSPLLDAFSLEPLPAAPVPEAAAVVELDTVEDPGFIPLSDTRIRGGSGILKLQAACGFRAFAEKRLWSTALETLEPGMDAAERGNIVHDALEYLWNQLRSQAALRALSSEERGALLSLSIEYGLRRFQRATSDDASPWEAAYLNLQRERLQRLLAPWLEIELARPPFEVKLREEEFEDVAIGPLLLSIRVDRVDRLLAESSDANDHPQEIILDYKTGISKPADWQGDRPDDPQLPLYAALRQPGTVAAVSFASLRPGKEMGLHGIAAREGILPKPTRLRFESLDHQIADWHRVLTALAQDFADGDARVRPKRFPGTCEFCAQRMLCRVDPALLEEHGSDDPLHPAEAEVAHG